MELSLCEDMSSLPLYEYIVRYIDPMFNRRIHLCIY
jgi:hypothetical protein